MSKHAIQLIALAPVPGEPYRANLQIPLSARIVGALGVGNAPVFAVLLDQVAAPTVDHPFHIVQAGQTFDTLIGRTLGEVWQFVINGTPVFAIQDLPWPTRPLN